MPDGSFGNGGAMRIAPVGLAYRHAPRAVLWNAVEAALLPTHVHPLAIDGAMVQAAAVGWLCQRRADEADCSPEGLLEYLRGMVHRLEAKGKLEALVEAVQEKVRGEEAFLQVGICVVKLIGAGRGLLLVGAQQKDLA